MLIRHSLCVASLGSLAFAGTISPSFRRHLAARQSDEEYDDTDLSGIKSLAAIGDSYSAGIGSGERLGGLSDLGAWSCSRYKSSHPVMVNNHPYLGDPAGRKFQFESCSGALTNEIKDNQVSRIDGDQDVILLSASGNDAALVDILNQCVFQFFSPTDILTFLAEKTPVGLALEAFGIADLGKYSRSCDEQLDFSEGLINDAAFSENIAGLIDATKAKLNSGGTLYYTGYSKFWDERASDDDWCSKPENTWSQFLSNTVNAFDWQSPVVLTADRRNRMNSLVDLVNTKISDAVAAAGDQVVFVNYDEYVGDVGGRFCAPGVQEPDKLRWNLGFYELDIDDPLGSSPFKRSGSTMPEGTFEGDINQMAELAFTTGTQYKDDSVSPSPNGNPNDKRSSFIPDGYGRIFHPTVSTHTMISELLVWNMQKRRDAGLGHSGFTDADSTISGDTCPLPDEPNQSPPNTCDMDKVSNIPYNVWDDGQGTAIYNNFCDNLAGLDKAVNYQETVDAHGNQQQSSKARLLKRTPPPNPDAYDGYTFQLDWVPNKNSNQCSTDCKGAFSSLAQTQCGHAGGQQNSLTEQATYDTGCGTYSWQITAPVDPGYATGTCCFHVNQWEEACKDDASNLFADITLVDNNKNTIYQTPDDVKSANSGLGQPINDPTGGSDFQGPLPFPVHLTGEHQNDYIQFSYNGLSWTSGTTEGPATCSAGGWDPKGGSQCPDGSPFGTEKINAKKQMDCCFPC